MLAEVMCTAAYRAYRIRLQTLLPISIDASDLDIHTLIAAGFAPAAVKTLYGLGVFSAEGGAHVIAPATLHTRVARGQRLTVGESDRLFRLAHVTALAEVVFANANKAQRWLGKPQARFLGQSPMALLSTSVGTRLVEAMLIQVAQGLAC